MTRSPSSPESATVSIKPMRLSDGRCDYFVSIKAGNREVTPHVFREEYKAAYHVALYDWLLNGSDKPSLIEFGPDDWPARITDAAATTPDREEVIHAICPHIKQWCDETDMPTVCNKCPATVKTSQGKGVQMCRLNAEAAADDVLAILGVAQGSVDLHHLVDWVHLYATEGHAWPDLATITEPLIKLASRAPTQDDAERLKAGASLKGLLAISSTERHT